MDTSLDRQKAGGEPLLQGTLSTCSGRGSQSSIPEDPAPPVPVMAQPRCPEVVQSFSHSGGERIDVSRELRMGKKPVAPVAEGTSKARVLTRGQTRTPTGPRQKGATPSWLEGGVGLDRRVIREEQRKDPGAVDAMMWIHNGC